MRRVLRIVSVLTLCLDMLQAGVVGAQEKTKLKIGEFVYGTINDQTYEVIYNFAGKKGDVVTLEMLPDPANSGDLNTAVELRDDHGQTLAHNDLFSWPLSLVVAELPEDGIYQAVATRSDGSFGKTSGDYMFRLSFPTLVDRGTNIDAKVSSDVDAPPLIYILRPEKDMPLQFNFRQQGGDLYASLTVLRWLPKDFPETVVNLDGTSGLTRAQLFTNLTAGYFYVLLVQQTSQAMRDPEYFKVTIGLI